MEGRSFGASWVHRRPIFKYLQASWASKSPFSDVSTSPASSDLTIPQIASAESENFAVLFEAKALHQSEDDDDTRKIKKPRKKLDSCLSCSGNSLFEKNESEFGDLDSGFMSKNEKKFELGLSIDGFHKGDESKNTEANSKIECCNENSVEQIQTLKNKDYDCPICFKVFPSSQAMGGHKRAHYIGILSFQRRYCSPTGNHVFLLLLPLTLLTRRTPKLYTSALRVDWPLIAYSGAE